VEISLASFAREVIAQLELFFAIENEGQAMHKYPTREVAGSQTLQEYLYSKVSLRVLKRQEQCTKQ
jgi:hypothetical protein